MWDDEMLDPFALSEGDIEDAYDNVPAVFRAAIKTSIAISAFHFHPRAGFGLNTLTVPHLGFQQRTSFSPASVALLIFSSTCKTPAQICAAATLANLSGAVDVLAISIDGKPSDEIIAALSICGINEIFALPLAEYKEFAEKLDGITPTIVFNDALNAEAREWGKKWLKIYDARPGNGIVIISPQFFDIALISLLYGIKPNEIISDFQPNVEYDAVFIDRDRVELPEGLKTRLILEPGCEGFWLFPGVDSEFFVRKCVALNTFAIPRTTVPKKAAFLK